MRQFITSRNILTIGLLAAFAFYGWLSYAVFPSYPVSFDEYGYFYQAQIFTHGQLTQALSNYNKLTLDLYFLFHNGHIFSKFPPGFPAVLALFLLLGIYQLLNPLITVIAFIFIYKTLAKFTTATTAAVITIIAAFNPYVFGYAASLFSQSMALMLSAAAFWAFTCYYFQRQNRYIYLIGAFIALGIVTRPSDFACVLISIWLGFFLSNRPLKAFTNSLIVTLVAVTGIIALAAYASLQAGQLQFSSYQNPLSSTLYMFDPHEATLLGKLRGGFYQFLINYDNNFRELFTTHFLKLASIPAFIFFCIGFIYIVRHRIIWMFIFHVFSIVILYNFHRTDGWAVYGARYWYSALGSFIILCGAGWITISSLSRKYLKIKAHDITPLIAATIVIYNIFWAASVTPKTITAYATGFRLYDNAAKNLENTCPQNTIVFLIPHKPHPVADKNKYIQDNFFTRNNFGNGKRLVIGPFSVPGIYIIKSPADWPPLEKQVASLMQQNPNYKLCYYQVDYYKH